MRNFLDGPGLMIAAGLLILLLAGLLILSMRAQPLGI